MHFNLHIRKLICVKNDGTYTNHPISIFTVIQIITNDSSSMGSNKRLLSLINVNTWKIKKPIDSKWSLHKYLSAICIIYYNIDRERKINFKPFNFYSFVLHKHYSRNKYRRKINIIRVWWKNATGSTPSTCSSQTSTTTSPMILVSALFPYFHFHKWYTSI